jgi:hypothetical protein
MSLCGGRVVIVEDEVTSSHSGFRIWQWVGV